MKNIDLNTPVFGEVAFEEADNLTVVHDEGYAKSREEAARVCERFDLDPIEDFWIKKYKDWDGGVCKYMKVLLTHRGLQRINSKLPKAKQFRPSCVSQMNYYGGIAFMYICDEQGVFVTGEANSGNNRCSYDAGTAAKRVYDAVVKQNAGINSIMTEQDAAMADGIPLEAESPEAEADNHEAAKRIRELEALLRKTNSDMEKLFSHYGVSSLEELTNEQLSDCESLASEKETRQKAAKERALKKAAAAPKTKAVEQSPPQADASPVAAVIAAKKAEAEMPDQQKGQLAEPGNAGLDTDAPAEELAAGEFVFKCLDTAPERFRKLNGKTLDQLGLSRLKPLFGNPKSMGREHVDPITLSMIDLWLSQHRR